MIQWKKSSFSSNQGNCVELGTDDGTAVIAVRNSRHPARGTLTFPRPAIAGFVQACAAGDLDDLAR